MREIIIKKLSAPAGEVIEKRIETYHKTWKNQKFRQKSEAGVEASLRDKKEKMSWNLSSRKRTRDKLLIESLILAQDERWRYA